MEFYNYIGHTRIIKFQKHYLCQLVSAHCRHRPDLGAIEIQSQKCRNNLSMNKNIQVKVKTGGFNSELVKKRRPRVEPLLNVSHSWSCGPPVSPQWNLNQTFNANVAHKEQFAQDGPNAVARTL